MGPGSDERQGTEVTLKRLLLRFEVNVAPFAAVSIPDAYCIAVVYDRTPDTGIPGAADARSIYGDGVVSFEQQNFLCPTFRSRFDVLYRKDFAHNGSTSIQPGFNTQQPQAGRLIHNVCLDLADLPALYSGTSLKPVLGDLLITWTSNGATPAVCMFIGSLQFVDTDPSA